ncbi:MAG: carboxypeptidase regulatory-like domain-containing protein [Acidobacteria bacterium]|nr:carboxypeptidase regulatory-like domain-containing protein [Acidobacteriota bacterium]
MKAHLPAIVIGVILGCFSAAVLGQGTTVGILGTVYDESRAVIPGVTVTATNQGTGQQRIAVSDDQGRYHMAEMTVGKYHLQAELPGFQTSTREVTVTLEGDSVNNFTLRVGEVTTEVLVTAESPMVDTTSSTLRTLVDERQIQDLPLNGRSFTDLVTLQSGVTKDYLANRSNIGMEGGQLMIAGTRSRQSLFQLDGTDLRNHRGTTPGSLAGVQLGVDTVQEFSVITAVANAEYGGFAGGVVNAVTKSGTNELHGSLFEFHRNAALDARNFFDRDPKRPLERSDVPPFKRNQYGVTLGGPIKKNRAFYFASYEGLNERLTTTQIGSVPSLDARKGVIPNRGTFPVHPLIQPLLDAWPLPNSTVRPDGTADYLYAWNQVIDQQFIVGKVDWQLGENDTISGRYTLDNATRDRPFSLDVIFDDSISRTNLFLVEWKRIFSANMVNQAQVSLNRFRLDQNYAERKPLPPIMHFNPLAVLPSGEPWRGLITVPTLSSLGANSQFSANNILNRFQYRDSLTYTTGAHSLKTGFNIMRIQLNNWTAQRLSGEYRWFTLEEFIRGSAPRDYQGTLSGLTPIGRRQYRMGFYLQDDWRAGRNLTLNFGVRYEPWTIPYEVAGRVSNCSDPSCSALTTTEKRLFTKNPSFKNFAPRVGVAWDPFGDGKTAIRAGYGLFYEPFTEAHYWGSPTRNFPITTEVLILRPPFPRPFVTPPDLSRVITNPWLFSDLIEQGGVHQYQFSVQRELYSSLVLKVEYTGSRGYNLAYLVDRNTAIPQRDANGVFPFYPANSVRRNPNFTRMRDTAWDASSWYNALGITLQKRFSRQFGLQASYTFSKSIDTNSSSGVSESRSQPNGLATFPEDVGFDKALSDFDARNRFTLNGSWNLPFLPGNAIWGGWKLSGVMTMVNGPRGTARINFNYARSRQDQDPPDRPTLIPGGNNNPVLNDGREPEKYFDDRQFILGDAGYFGNVGRNTIEYPGVFLIDLGIHKDFHFTEEKYLQFRGEMFNIANRANFMGPAATIILNAAGARPLTVGRITQTSTTSRQIQLGLKFFF